MTQMEEARGGRITAQMREVAAQEHMPEDIVRERIAAGVMSIPFNRRRIALGLPQPKGCGIGLGLRTKVNANIGTSQDFPSPEAEFAKLTAACESGADAIMDLSTGGDIQSIRRSLLERCPVPVGTVPIYDAAVQAFAKGGGIKTMTAIGMMQAVQAHAEQGVDFLTIHCGVTREVIRTLERSPRVCGIVSRGGTFLSAWMSCHNKENPFYEQFDDILALCREHDVTISLGDGLRPGALADAMDRAQLHELNILAELVQRCREAGVQTIVEGPGHVPLQQVETQVRLQKELCKGAPFYVLGPLVTDVAPGYDHITAAIGGAVAAAAGVDFICYVTPAEHLGLPDIEHVREGVIAARIAGHAGDIAKGIPGAAEWDRDFSTARRARDWDRQLNTCMDPIRAHKLRAERRPGKEEVCSMCGEFCTYRITEEAQRQKNQGTA